MSFLVVPDEGEKALLNLLRGGGMAGVTVKLKLFKSNTTPTQATVLADFTEADFSGYNYATPSFGAATTDGSNKGVIQDSAARVFTHNGGGTANTVYGYYIEDTTNGKLLWAERFDASQSVSANGDNISVTAKLTAQSEN